MHFAKICAVYPIWVGQQINLEQVSQDRQKLFCRTWQAAQDILWPVLEGCLLCDCQTWSINFIDVGRTSIENAVADRGPELAQKR